MKLGQGYSALPSFHNIMRRGRSMKHKSISYAKWGYIFIAPFFVVFLVCTFYPLLSTFYNSLFENYFDASTFTQVGPNFVGFGNFKKIFTASGGSVDILTYTANTMIMWVAGAIPQLAVSLLLAVIFTSTSLNIKGQTFFKTVIYLPNLIMAAAFAMLFFTLFSTVGPVNQIISGGNPDKVVDFFNMVGTSRGIIAFINFLMWFGNTTIMLMAGIMGIDQSLLEAAAIDGATSGQVFRRITLPLLSPILVYVVITSLIGGFQMYDVPQVITSGLGNPNRSTMTLIMYLNRFMGTTKNYGMAGTVSVIVFIITGILSFAVYRSIVGQRSDPKPKKSKNKGVL